MIYLLFLYLLVALFFFFDINRRKDWWKDVIVALLWPFLILTMGYIIIYDTVCGIKRKYEKG